MAVTETATQSEALETLLGRIQELAVLPHVVYKILEMSGSDDASFADIERAIVVDPGFSSRLLVAANSAYYALPKQVTNIREATQFLGMKAIRQIAMTVGVYDMFVGKTDKESLRRRAWWRHSVDTAVCCRFLARQTRTMAPDDAYTSGLLHWIGKTMLDRFGGKDYELVEKLVERGATVPQAERAVFGCIHTEVAAAAAAKWRFPEALAAGLDYLNFQSSDPTVVRNRAVVALASQISSMALTGTAGSEMAWNLEAAELLGLTDPAKLHELVEGAREAISTSGQLAVA